MTKRRALEITVFTTSLGGYVWLGYFTPRTDFVQVVGIYCVLFGLYILILQQRLFSDRLRVIIGAALILRLALLMMTPNLSGDYFRFVWDGLLTTQGQNPYLVLPSALISGPVTIPGITPDLFSHLNSADYYSVYPPLCQYLFALSARLNGGELLGNVVTMRIFLLLAEFGTLVMLYKLANKLALPSYVISLYVFNPLIIIELTGNLHFEAVMICFLLLAVYLLIDGKPIYSALIFALAVGTKLVPAIFLPLILRRLGWKTGLRYFLIVAGVLVLLFLPFFSDGTVSNFVTNLGVYFQKFEFNASVFYIVRWIGFQVRGYDIITTAGVVMAAVSAALIILIAVRDKSPTWRSLFSGMLLSGTVYYALATTVHPWYLAPLLALSVFTGFRYPLVWTLMVILSYATYRTFPYLEDLRLVALEYGLVWGWFAYEMMKRRKLRAGLDSFL